MYIHIIARVASDGICCGDGGFSTWCIDEWDVLRTIKAWCLVCRFYEI